MPTMAQKLKKQQKRESIIDAAEQLFFEKGYDNVSMNDIAKEVKLNRATLYFYFENKEALCFAVVLRGVHLLKKMVNGMVKAVVPHSHRIIDNFGGAYYCFFSVYPQYLGVYNLFQSGRFDLSSVEGSARDDVNEILRLQNEIFEDLYSFIKEVKTYGKLPSDVDPFYATILVMTSIENMLNTSPFLKRKLKDSGIKYAEGNFIYFVYQLIKNKS